MTPPTRDQLHAALDALLDGLPIAGQARASDTQSEALWRFVALLAEGRGIAGRYHGEGLEAVADTPTSPAATLEDRQRARYHQRVLLALLLDVDGGGKHGPLPRNFATAAIAADLLNMLSGMVGTGEAEPLLLKSEKRGNAQMRRFARRAVVLHVLSVAGETGRSLQDVYTDLPSASGLGLEPGTWANWRRAVEKVDREVARAAGAAGDRSHQHEQSDIEERVRLAQSGPGSTARK